MFVISFDELIKENIFSLRGEFDGLLFIDGGLYFLGEKGYLCQELSVELLDCELIL